MRRETITSAAINAALSAAFTLGKYGGMPRVPFGGSSGLVVDALPQGFMVALMVTAIPGLLGIRAVRRGLLPTPREAPTLGRLLLSAGGFAAAAGGLTVLLSFAAWTLVAGPVPFGQALAAKVAVGAALGGAVTWVSLRRMLSDA